MKNLIEISKIVTKKKVRKIEIFDDYTLKYKNSKFNDFYEALTAGKFKNDRDAATFLYGSSPTDDKYRQLKSRFKKRLLNTIFFLDVNLPSTSNNSRAYFSCNKDWTLVKILIANNANLTAKSVASQILTIALKYKFADIIVNCCRILRNYSAEDGNEKSFEEYDQLVKQYSHVLDAEIRSEELFQRVIINYPKPNFETSELKEKIDTYCEALVGMSEIYDSPVIKYNTFMVWIHRYEMLKEYEEMVNSCKKGEAYIESNPLYYREDKLGTFLLKKMTGYLHLQDFSNGKMNTEKALKLYDKGSEYWYIFMEYYFLLAFHTENYINALAIFNQVISNNKFKKQQSIIREKWEVFSYYLNYIIEINEHSDSRLFAMRKKNFKVTKVLNHHLLYPKDQKMYTIHILIAQLLFLIERKSFNQMVFVIEKLRNNQLRQLKKPEFFRISQFIKLLHQLAKADFEVEHLSNVHKYYERLVDNPFSYRGLLNQIEIIPYEKLWNHILKRISN